MMLQKVLNANIYVMSNIPCACHCHSTLSCAAPETLKSMPLAHKNKFDGFKAFHSGMKVYRVERLTIQNLGTCL